MRSLFIIPAINEQMTDGCIENIDPEYYDDVMIVDNTIDGFASKYGVGRVRHEGRNVGVGRAWNAAAREVIEEEYDYLVILSATMRFHDGMKGLVQALDSIANGYGMETQHGWHCIALHRMTLIKCGLFDENFYPAYYEDSDYIRRMELMGIHNPMSTTQRLPFVEIKAGFEGNAHGMKKGKVAVNMGACRDYFIKKWGNDPRYDTQRDRDILYKHPFNDPTKDISYFPTRSIDELYEEYRLAEFESDANLIEEKQDEPSQQGR